MVENFDKMLSGSLRLEEPWYIIGAEFHEEEAAIHIHVGVDKAAALCCPVCGAPTKRYGYEPKERIWRHADCLFYPFYVHCRRPRVLCDKCDAVQVNAPFERKNSRWMRRCRLQPIKDAALTLRHHGAEILNFFDTRLTNAICEGINSMIQAAKRKARGFQTFEGYAAMIYLVAGKLDLATPVPF